jgi:hypothetical protein
VLSSSEPEPFDSERHKDDGDAVDGTERVQEATGASAWHHDHDEQDHSRRDIRIQLLLRVVDMTSPSLPPM